MGLKGSREAIVIEKNQLIGKKVLSVRQPFAGLIVAGIKQYELRTWTTEHRGDLLIHASGSPHKQKRAALKLYPQLNFETMGAIIGLVKLIDILPVSEVLSEIGPLENLAGHFTYAWRLSDVQDIEPIPALGRLGLWTFNG